MLVVVGIAVVVVSVVVDRAEIQATPSVLTFTSLNFDVSQPVTISGLDDLIDEGYEEATIVQHTMCSAQDIYYDGLRGPNLTVGVADNDLAGVHITGGRHNLTEGEDEDVYSVVLNSMPEGVVVIEAVPLGMASSGRRRGGFGEASGRMAH